MTRKFWQFINGSPVRLKLKPGQTLNHYRFNHHDEGWSSETNTWTNNDGEIINKCVNDGRDCDGRLTRYGVYRLKDLAVIQEFEGATFNGQPIFYPTWEEVSANQRDEYAEAMNY